MGYRSATQIKMEAKTLPMTMTTTIRRFAGVSGNPTCIHLVSAAPHHFISDINHERFNARSRTRGFVRCRFDLPYNCMCFSCHDYFIVRREVFASNQRGGMGNDEFLIITTMYTHWWRQIFQHECLPHLSIT